MFTFSIAGSFELHISQIYPATTATIRQGNLCGSLNWTGSLVLTKLEILEIWSLIRIIKVALVVCGSIKLYFLLLNSRGVPLVDIRDLQKNPFHEQISKNFFVGCSSKYNYLNAMTNVGCDRRSGSPKEYLGIQSIDSSQTGYLESEGCWSDVIRCWSNPIASIGISHNPNLFLFDFFVKVDNQGSLRIFRNGVNIFSEYVYHKQQTQTFPKTLFLRKLCDPLSNIFLLRIFTIFKAFIKTVWDLNFMKFNAVAGTERIGTPRLYLPEREWNGFLGLER